MMLTSTDPIVEAVTGALRAGELDAVRLLLAGLPGLATARIGTSGPDGTSRTLLHVLTDWPGHVPNGAEAVAILVGAGAEVDARFKGPHEETPLHWAASSDDVRVLDALLDAGADIEAGGAVIAGGTPLSDARAFAQWRAAHRLVERGAATALVDEAALGLMDRIAARFEANEPPAPDEVDVAFWNACHGGQRAVAQYLLDRGASLDWLPGWEEATPLDAAARSEATEVVGWLESLGARRADGVSDHR